MSKRQFQGSVWGAGKDLSYKLLAARASEAGFSAQDPHKPEHPRYNQNAGEKKRGKSLKLTVQSN